jgi:hypothetical protein
LLTKTLINNIGRLAQLVEQRPYKARVGGSSPSTPTNIVIEVEECFV